MMTGAEMPTHKNGRTIGGIRRFAPLVRRDVRPRGEQRMNGPTTEAEPTGKKYGCISVAAPFAGVALVIGFGIYQQQFGADTTGWAALAAAVFVAPCVILGGTAAAIISFRRRERPLILAVVGLLLSLGPILWLIIAWIWTAWEGPP